MRVERPVGVGIIGTGVGVRTILPGMRRTGRAEVVALSGRSQARVEEVGGPLGIPLLTSDYHRVCEDDRVDLICVASPNDLHMEHARAALSTGRHVYLEKPMGINAAEARAIAELARSEGRLVVVGHQLRFNPYLRAMRDAIASGAVGRVYHLSIAQHGSGFSNPSRKWTWEFDVERGGGVRLAMGSHMVDLGRFFLGNDAQAIAAELDPVFSVRTPEGGEPRECRSSNFFGAVVTFPATAVHMSTTAAAHAAPRFDIVAYGEEGDLTFDLSRTLLLHRLGTDPVPMLAAEVDAEYRHRQASSIFSTSFSYFADEIVDVILANKSELPDAATVDDAVRCMEVLDAALLSATHGSRELLQSWETRPFF
jgi:predicted dehydrogenase